MARPRKEGPRKKRVRVLPAYVDSSLRHQRRDETGAIIGGKIVGDEDVFRSIPHSALSLKEQPVRIVRRLPRLDASARYTTRRDVERRVLLACKTIRALPDKEQRFQGDRTYQGGVWGNVVQEFMDAYNSTDARPPRFQPSPSNISDCMTCLEWCTYLEEREFKLVWWRSFDISFGVIAGRIGRSDETARRHYDAAIDKVWYASCIKATA